MARVSLVALAPFAIALMFLATSCAQTAGNNSYSRGFSGQDIRGSISSSNLRNLPPGLPAQCYEGLSPEYSLPEEQPNDIIRRDNLPPGLPPECYSGTLENPSNAPGASGTAPESAPTPRF